MNISFLLILSGLFIGACKSEASKTDGVLIPKQIQKLENLAVIPIDAKPLKHITFEEEHRFGEIFPALIPPSRGFGPDNVVDNEGRVYRSDKKQGNIQVFDEIGNQIGTIGRRGKGPGEFEDITAISIKEDRLIVFDSNLLRVSEFDKNSLKLLNSFTFDIATIEVSDDVKFSNPRTLHAFKDSVFVTAFLLKERNERFYNGYYVINKHGEILSKRLFEQQNLATHTGTATDGNLASIRLPFSSEGLFDIADDGTIFLANTNEFLISVLNSDGAYLQSIYVPFKNARLKKSEFKQGLNSHLKSIYKNADYPETWPALADLFVDNENRIWISTNVDDKSVREWWVLNRSGELISKFNWPADDKIVDIKNGRFYVEEQEVKYQSAKEIVGYKINFSDV